MLKLENVSFSYNDRKFIKNMSFDISKGENVSIIGASGCGKSTLLQIIYGLHHVSGKIFWNDRQLLGPNFNIVPGEEFIKYQTQDFDLMPPLTVAENVGKFLSNMYPRKKKQRIRELLELVEMQELANTKAKFLSGGQQQRIALARVLANEPEILLLDEPFSHIDHFRKNELRRNLFSHLKEKQITTLIATHDSTDALSFADKTIAMREGRIIEMGVPEELYHNPGNAYVASLFGEVNEITAALLNSNSSKKKIILYPHEISLSKGRGIPAIVKRSFFRGSNFLIEARIAQETVFFQHAEKLKDGKEVFLHIDEALVQSRMKRKEN